MTYRTFLIGDPVAHSISPAIHKAAFSARQLDWTYEAIRVPSSALAEFVRGLRQTDVVGANVTVPHKEAVVPLCDDIDAQAREIGAVNTITHRAGRLFAQNTDVVGFSRLLAEAGVVPAGRLVVLLGAGGAARAVAESVLRDGAGRLVIANRTISRAQRLADSLRLRHATPVDVAELTSLGHMLEHQSALIVNTTTVGMHGEALPIDARDLRGADTVVDIIYTPPITPLLRAAQALGLRTVGGLGMLVHQAAAAWEIWTEQSPPLDVMYSAARRALQANR